MLQTLLISRQFSTGVVRQNSGLYNFKKMEAFNKRWSKQHKKMMFKNKKGPAFPDAYVDHYGVRSTGVKHGARFEQLPERIPELIVPDNLEDTDLKPYVSYATEDVYQDELTSEDLFNVIYGRKIIQDFKENKLDAEGNSLQPNELEQLSPEQAESLALQTGSDIFTGGAPYSKTFALKIPIGKR